MGNGVGVMMLVLAEHEQLREGLYSSLSFMVHLSKLLYRIKLLDLSVLNLGHLLEDRIVVVRSLLVENVRLVQ
jgi:hypothetical protein